MSLLPKYASGVLTTPDGAGIEFVDIRSKGSGLPVLFVPGAGDGLRTVRSSALPLVIMYRRYARNHRVIFVSRRTPILAGSGVRDLARDYSWAASQLGVDQFHVQSSSAGGPVGQWLAIDQPGHVKSLVLGETFAHVDEHLRRVLVQWIEWSERREWYTFLRDTVLKTYTPTYVRKIRWALPFLRFMPAPREPMRPVHLLNQLLNVDNRSHLREITCPTLVIGGDADEVVPVTLQTEMAEGIADARTVIIPGYGHGAYQEAGTQYERYVLNFISEVEKGAPNDAGRDE